MRCVITGASFRAFALHSGPLAEHISDDVDFVGIFDTNRKRAELLKLRSGNSCAVYSDFDEMLQSEKPDYVFVYTIDRYHHEYIIKALKAGCNVVTTKPLTIDEDKCNAILAAEKKSEGKVKVLFNGRFITYTKRLRELIQKKEIGDVISINFEWLLDSVHGADYFRRWHRKKENSGGLIVHLGCHHFDFINWILNEDPIVVHAFGERKIFGSGRSKHGTRCLGCEYSENCEYFFDITEGDNKSIYADCEDVDGYFRDSCVFSEDIDIEDTMSLLVRYTNNIIMNYSLTAHSPYEGFRLAINGTEGRIEDEDFHGRMGPFIGENKNGYHHNLKIYNRDDKEVRLQTPPAKDLHLGGDHLMLQALFRPNPVSGRSDFADSREGVMASLVGIAANRSIKEGRPVYIRDLLDKQYF